MSDPVEHHAVENVIARLTARFPSLSQDRVQQVVDEELARFEDGRVRSTFRRSSSTPPTSGSGRRLIR